MMQLARKACCGLAGVERAAVSLTTALRHGNIFVQNVRMLCGAGVASPDKFDLVVIGGGSGGIACAREASKLGKKVALLDYVDPSPHGTTWGLGGTCVNVGCIPKKIMHYAGSFRDAFSDARSLGWIIPSNRDCSHDWGALVSSIQDHIRSQNFGYRVNMLENGVHYVNARATFDDAHTVVATLRDGSQRRLMADNFVIAVGSRPNYLGVEGDKEHCITSDDVFSLSNPPGKTLIVGAGYIALETAGFLNELGFEVHVMARSLYLRGFDRQMADLVVDDLRYRGVHFSNGCIPVRFSKAQQQIRCEYACKANAPQQSIPEVDRVIDSEHYDTVMLAVGRRANTHALSLPRVGVHVGANGKIPTTNERTSVPHIYAVGDVIEGKHELTPVAIKAGVRLARRIFGASQDVLDYNMIPTTVFTPLEYSCVGDTEESATMRYGEDAIEVWHANQTPLAWVTNQELHGNDSKVRRDNGSYFKVIALRDGGRVVGMHYAGPYAGEIMQGFAVAMRGGMTKQQLDDTLGIHPTIAEQFTTMNITKRSGVSPHKRGC